MDRVLITGGLGYIGQFLTKIISDSGFIVDVIDYKKEHKLCDVKNINCIEGDFSNEKLLDDLFRTNKYVCIIHLAAYISVGESVKCPEKYLKNNLENSITLFRKTVEYRIENLIFASSAATYGDPKLKLINEETKQNPINPYGQTKLDFEKYIINSNLNNLNYLIFRFFNVAGANNKYGMGYRKDIKNPPHLIPNIVKKSLNNEVFNIFGNNAETKDKTCVRDYVHVEELAHAIYLGFKNLIKNNIKNEIFNISSGKPISNLEVVNEFISNINGNFKYEMTQGREGDPDYLVGDNTKIKQLLKWKPTKEMKEILKSENEWFKN